MTLELHAEVRDRDAVLDLSVGDGETVAVLGPNGSGKSTLLAVAAGLVRADAGAGTLDGETLFDAARGIFVPSHRRRIALLDQRASLFPHLGALGNVEFGARGAAAGSADARARARGWLEAVEAGDLARRRSTALSGGQAQRVALARALAAEPRVILLDEPLAALDVGVAPSLRRTLRRVLADRSAVLVTHDVLDVWALADRVAVVEGGRVVAAGSTDEVLRVPPTAFTAELVGLAVVTGLRTASGVRLTDGRELPGRPRSTVAEGMIVRAVVDPASVRLGPTGVAARVLALEPRGSVVRIRTDLVPVDVPPATIRGLAEGDAVTLEIPPLDLHPVEVDGSAG